MLRPLALCICCLALGVSAPAAETPLEKRAADVVALFRADPGGYEQIFSASFLGSVSPATLTSLFTGQYAGFGRCLRANVVSASNPETAKLEFLFEKGFSVPGNLSIDPAEPHLITGLWFGAAVRLLATIGDVVNGMKELPGEVSFLAARLGVKGIEPLAALNADRSLAIGSTFKLYILAELIRSIRAGERRWSDVTALRAPAFSYPTGTLQKWPTGSPLTLHTLAALMISVSDNTAADHLLWVLGRDRVEKMLVPLGNSSPAHNIPFLSTLEMFKLKGDPAGKLAETYLAKDAAGRLAFLDGEVARIPRDSISVHDKPEHISDIEWFASAADLCRAMDWIRKQTEASPAWPARAILAINPGISVTDKKWRYIGYKGGSEPGVLNLTLLLRSEKGEWYALSASWNNEKAPVDLNALLPLVQRALQLM